MKPITSTVTSTVGPVSFAVQAGLPLLYDIYVHQLWVIGPQDAVGLVASWRLRDRMWYSMPYELHYLGWWEAYKTLWRLNHER
ncbi:MAG: hypothetical protein JWM85_3598 [Acidimicrobiaceae bacterium]|nr:hypothetical protein [Acidimicrobiaceae bacterium]